MKTKILFVLTRSPYPSVDGTRERILGELKELSADFDINLLIIGNEDIKDEAKQALKNIISGEIIVFKLSKIGCYLRSGLSLFSGKPLQSAYFSSYKALKWFKINEGDYQTIIFHTLRFGTYINHLKKFKSHPNSRFLLSFNDAISLNYQDASKKAHGLWRLIYSVEANRIKNYELEMLNLADGFSIISERDKKYLIANWQIKYPNSEIPEIQVVRNSLDDSLFNYNYAPQTNNLVFIGNLFYPPNRQGLLFFCKHIWPGILKEKPETKFLIIGRGGPEYFSSVPNSEILGFIEDPCSLMIKQSLFISPADFGAGVPTKTLLAMALGLPVISTETNAQGIEGVVDGENICLIDYKNPEVAIKKIITALGDETYRKKIGINGKELISKDYKQSANYSKLKNFISR